MQQQERDARTPDPAEDVHRDSPAPYDVASEDTPDNRVIRKGEHERPGPTSSDLNAVDSGTAQQDGLLQTNQTDRGGELLSAGSGGMSGSLEDEELRVSNQQQTESLGGDGLHRAINNEPEGDIIGDEEDLGDGDDVA